MRGDVLVAPDAGHLLHQVLRPLHVVPPAGDAVTLALGAKPERLEDPADLRLGHRRAQQRLHRVRPELDHPRRRWPGLDVDASLAHRGPRDLGHQRRSVVQHLGEHRPVYSALEPVGGLAGELVSPGHAPDDPRVPVRRLEQHPGRRRRDLGLRPAHRPRQRLRAAGVLDDQVVGDQRPSLPVEGGQRLASARPPHPEEATLDLVQVEGVEGLPQLEHHVVGHVDHVADAAHPAPLQPPAHPLRRRSRSGRPPAPGR